MREGLDKKKRRGVAPTGETQGEEGPNGTAPPGDEHLYRAFFRDAADGVLFATAGGEEILDANGEACRILGRTREEVLAEGGAIFDPSDPRLGAAREEQRRTGKFRGELRVMRRIDKTDVPFAAAVTVVGYKDQKSGEERLVIVLRDVAGRRLRRTGEEFRGTEEWFYSLARYTSDIVVVLDADGSMRYVSPSTERVLGYAPEEIVGTVMLDVIHPEDFERTIETFAGLWDTPGVSPPVVFRARHKDGLWLHMELGTNNLLDDEEVRGVVIIGRDITEQVRTEEETQRRNEELESRVAESTRQLTALVEELRESERTLRENEEHFRKLNEATFEGIAIHEKGRVLECNETFARMFGYEPHEAIGMSAIDFAAPESRDLVLQKSVSGVWESYEAVGIKKDGTRIVVEIRGRPSTYRERPVRLTAMRDVTELKEKERELRESEERFRSLVQNVSDIITVLGADGTILYESPAVERSLEYGPEELVGQIIFDYLHPDDIERIEAELSRAWQGEETQHSPVEFRFRHKNGSWRYFEAIGNNLLSDPAVGGIVLNSRDITERKLADRALRESEERFRSIFEVAPTGIAHVGLDGRWLKVNNKLCEIVDYNCEELQQKTFQEITHPEDLDADLNQVKRLLEGEISEYSMDKRYVKKDGSHVWIELKVSLARDASGEPAYLVSVVEDVDKRKRAELILASLTPRESEVLELLARGRSNPEIACDLSISANTAKFHVRRVLEKLGATDRGRAAYRAAELGLFHNSAHDGQ